jgi:hypothetical protein
MKTIFDAAPGESPQAYDDLGASMLTPALSRRKLPVNLVEHDFCLFEHELEREIPPTRVLSIPDVRVNWEGLIFRGARILPESYTGSIPRQTVLTSVAFCFRNYATRRHVDVLSSAVWPINNWSRNYFHWLTDALPRLCAVPDLVRTSRVVLPGSYQRLDYVTSSLRAIGITNPMFVPRRRVFHLKELLLPAETALGGNYNDALMKHIRLAFTGYFGPKGRGAEPGDRIYISRSRATRRRVLNDSEVVATLERFGFRTLHCEDLPFSEQARTLLNAKYLVANHGAGLTNMLFMDSGSSVLELRKKDDAKNNCYFSLASALDLRYFYQNCDSDTPERDPNGADIIVDVGKLKENVALMLGSGR